MIDDERQRLCAALRAQVTESWFYLDSENACHGIVRSMGDVAADEIEQLAALAQSDAEPASGLIEAAELLELCARRSGERQARWFDKAARLLRSHHADSSALADVIETRRTRAADRSTK